MSDNLSYHPAPEEQPAPQHWGLDGLGDGNIVLLASHLHKLRDASPKGDWAWVFNHAICSVDVMGLVISADLLQANGREHVRFTLDDSTGLIDCIVWAGDESSSHRRLAAPALGTLVRALGKLSHFRGARQVSVERFWIDPDPMSECFHWQRAAQLWRDRYSRPFRLPAGEVDSCAAAITPSAARTPAADLALEPLLQAVVRAAASVAPGDGVRQASVLQAGGAALKGWKGQDVLSGLDRLVERSQLYLVDDGPGRPRTYRPVGTAGRTAAHDT